MDDYEDESFEEDEKTLSPVDNSGNWKTISFEEVELGEQLGGGSVGLVHRGAYAGKAVALKTLVSITYDTWYSNVGDPLMIQCKVAPCVLHRGPVVRRPILLYVLCIIRILYLVVLSTVVSSEPASHSPYM